MAQMTFRQVAEKTGRKLETVFQEFTQDMAETVIMRTPVITGFLRGSWFAEVNGERGPQGSEDKGGGVTIASINATISQAKVGDVITIGNNAEYAEAVEFGGANRQPRAMVRSTVRDQRQILARTAARIRRR